MNKTPLITTIIPTYNRANLLKFAIASVQNQTFHDLQILVLDNFSTDNTANVVSLLSKKDSRIKYHRHSTNIGPGANLKYGYDQVDTPFFSILADDDVLLPEFYERAYRLLTKYPQAGVSAGQMIFIKTNGSISSVSCINSGSEEYYPVGHGLTSLGKGNFPGWTASLFRKSSVESIGGLNNHTIMDAELVLNMIIHHSFVVFKYPCAIFVCADLNPENEAKIQLFSKERAELIRTYQNQANLSEASKNIVTQALVSNDQQVFFRWFIKALIFKDWNLADIVRNKIVLTYGKSFKSDLYKHVIVACKNIFIVHYLFLIAYKFAKLTKDVANNYRYRKYRSYVNYCAQLYYSKFGENWFKKIRKEKFESF